jgi:NTP pyrophosphatase (non-canonical NTP hydrolase)
VALEFDGFQREVAHWVAEHGGFFPPLANLARLAEEVGELARCLNAEHGPKRPKLGEALPEVAEELGDIVFVVAVLAEQLGVSLGASAEASLAKARRRDGERFSS